MFTIPSLLVDTLHLFFPHHCNGCCDDVLEKNHLLCISCYNKLPRTNFSNIPDNIIEKIFYGRLPLSAAYSEFYFSKGQLIQQLVHQLKYKGNKEIGFYLGEMMGESLLKSSRFSNIDAIVPLPMYANKENIRGYNQATILSKGIESIMRVPVLDKIITRNRATETQTRKHRTERWLNVDGSFFIKDIASLIGKNILLVDDVITTGATLEACGQLILKLPGTNLSIATLAQASK